MKQFDLTSTPIAPAITLLEASAGTGKTYTLAGLVLRMLVEGAITHVREVAVVTFTNAATDELLTRVRQRLQEALETFETPPPDALDDPLLQELAARLQEDAETCRTVCQRLRTSLRDFDEVNISTIHTFCLRTLQTAAFETRTPFEMAFVLDDADLCDTLARDYWRKTFYGDMLLTSVAESLSLSHADFLTAFKTYRQYPHATLYPPSPSLTEAREVLEQAYREVQAAWTQDTRSRIEAELASITYATSSDKNKHARIAFYAEEEQRTRNLDTLQAFCQAASLAEAAPHLQTALKFIPASICAVVKSAKARPGKEEALLAIPLLQKLVALEPSLEALSNALRNDFLGTMRDELDAYKRRQQVLCADDLLSRLQATLRDDASKSAIRDAMHKRYRAVLVDEFQDTDPMQCDIFLTAFDGADIPMYFIGDPKQAIYKFRGADIYAYLDALRHAQHTYSLGTNYRSACNFVDAVNAFFERVPNSFVQQDIRFQPVNAHHDKSTLHGDGKTPLHIWAFPPGEGKDGTPKALSKAETIDRLNAQVTQEIVHLLGTSMTLDNQPVRPGDIAILTRDNEQAQGMQASLHAAGVPGIIAKGGQILDSSEFNDLELILNAILNNKRPSEVCTAMGTRLWAKDAAAIHALLDDDDAWQETTARMQDYCHLWQQNGLIAMMERFLVREEIRPRLLAADGGTRHLTNLRHSLELLHTEAVTRHLSPDALLAWIPELRATAGSNADERELRLETDEDAVQILTMHKSKGLEFPIVFCPYLAFSKAPRLPFVIHQTEPPHTCLAFEADDEMEKQARLEALAEDLRLAYVAITRAKHRCYLAWGWFGNRAPLAQNSALGYLLHAPTCPQLAERDPLAVLNDIKQALPDPAAMLRPLAEAHPSLISVEPCAAEPAPPARWEQEKSDGSAFHVREFPAGKRSFPQWRVVSYSGIKESIKTGHVQHTETEIVREHGEYDASGGSEMLRFGKEGVWTQPGNIIGDCLHKILENADLQDLHGETTRCLLDRELRLLGVPERKDNRNILDGEISTITTLLETVANLQLPNIDVPLRDIPRAQQFHEWKYHHALASVSPERLAQAFATDPQWADYSQSLGNPRNLPPIKGYMTGILDLLFLHDDKWYILDWKSDSLGDAQEAYSPDRLAESVAANHYVLQYHLYTVALMRFLQGRMQGAFEYDTHIGGAYYIYLRGLSADGQTGVYYDRPSRALIETLDTVLCRETPHA